MLHVQGTASLSRRILLVVMNLRDSTTVHLALRESIETVSREAPICPTMRIERLKQFAFSRRGPQCRWDRIFIAEQLIGASKMLNVAAIAERSAVTGIIAYATMAIKLSKQDSTERTSTIQEKRRYGHIISCKGRVLHSKSSKCVRCSESRDDGALGEPRWKELDEIVSWYYRKYGEPILSV